MTPYLKRLEQAIHDHWEAPALSNYKGEGFTFAQLAEKIEKFHMFFEAAGVKKGDKIAICAKNSARWAVSFLSISSYEAVVVPILADFNPDSINALVDHSESILLFTDDELWKKIDITKMPAVRGVISTNSFTLLHSADEGMKNAFDSLAEAFANKYPMGFSRENVCYPEGNASDLALINYTSGTTSAPKGVMLRYECLDSNIEFALDHIPVNKGESIVSMLPMAHMYGMAFEFIYPLCGGAHVIFLGKTPSPALLLGAMGEHKPYILITVPLVLEKVFKGSLQPKLEKPAMKILTKIPGIRNILFNKIRETLLSKFGGNVRTIVMGGAALNPEVEYWFRKFKLPYTVGYGMTECAPLLAYSDWTTFAPKSCGVAVDRMQVRIDSEDPVNTVGEIQVKGINVMSGYFKNPEATAAAFTEDGWLRTGDLGVVDAAGNVFIRGRSKNMILSSNGQNIYPEEIEAVCNVQPYVVESVVVDRGSKLVALLYVDKEAAAKDGLDAEALSDKLEEMRVTVNKAMPNYSKITKIEVVDQPFEKTPKMSIKRFMYA
ncbi:MAG: AMP-binding protein [Bacteroidales bacterium]|nr:AMP-binding protein [Bacteroidales bacterium]